MRFFWNVKNLFLDGWYYIMDLIFSKYLLLKKKKKIFSKYFDVILNSWTMIFKHLMLFLTFKLYA